MNRNRQRAAVAVLLAAVASVGCEARSSVEAAQTAVVVVRTAVPVVSEFPSIAQGLLPGSTITVKVSPDGADSTAATDVAITATDSGGTLQQMDSRARQAATIGALLATAQYYPNATIALTVVDTAGNTLVVGKKAAGGQPSVQ